MLKRLTIAILFTATFAPQSPTDTGPLPRKVEGNAIISTSDPAARIELLNSPLYVGSDRWILYGFSHCELHAFVQADSRKKVQRLYWIQFESYLPSRPELHHTYDSPRHASMNGLDFYVDTWLEPTNKHVKPGSDVGHIRNLLEAHGYKLPSAMMSVRLVHLLDDQRRKELMFIYSEDVASTGLTPSELQSGDPAHDRWPKIESALIERAEKAIAIHPLSHP
jgi:hypothetical protein